MCVNDNDEAAIVLRIHNHTTLLASTGLWCVFPVLVLHGVYSIRNEYSGRSTRTIPTPAQQFVTNNNGSINEATDDNDNDDGKEEDSIHTHGAIIGVFRRSILILSISVD